MRASSQPALDWVERISVQMRLCLKLVVVAVLFALPAASQAATCTAQGELASEDRVALSTVAGRIADAVINQDFNTLEAALLPAESAAWEQIRAAIEQAGPVVKGGKAQLRNLYLLDASMQTAPADTQFFCSNSNGTLTITINMHALPPGRYAIALVDAAGSQQAGQLGIVLAWDSASWRFAGLTTRPGVFDGHDGVWYWSRARGLAKADPWSSWYSYDAARFLLLPLDYISSPNLEKLQREQSEIVSSPQSTFPYDLKTGDRIWKVDAVVFDPSLAQPDLAIVYESTGVTDPAAQRTEASSVFSAFLKAQPGIRANFHGLWAYAMINGKRTPIIELPMSQIP
jgi:hypothetical protein